MVEGVRTLAFLIVFGWCCQASSDATLPPKHEDAASPVPCRSIRDCWLDADGTPIARPRRLRGKAIPKGDCGGNILWLRNRLACDQGRCVAAFIGDRC